MPEPADEDSVAERVRSAAPGLVLLLAEAQKTWNKRVEEAGGDHFSRPGWRAFEDAFPTFYQFTNRPR